MCLLDYMGIGMKIVFEYINMEADKETRYVRSSFYVTYVLLITTGSICLIEALRNPNPTVRHIMNIETCISIAAAFFYAQFIKDLEGGVVDYKKINDIRYLDWSITTPLMLLGLGLVFSANNKTSFKLQSFVLILVLNYAMLYVGYKGEMREMDKKNSFVLGFVFFFALYAVIFGTFLTGKGAVMDNYLIFGAYFVFWAMYGLVYFSNEKIKNITYNILDLFAKCIMGIFFYNCCFVCI